MEFTYKTKGTCSQQISFTLEENKLKNVRFLGGLQRQFERHLQPGGGNGRR